MKLSQNFFGTFLLSLKSSFFMLSPSVKVLIVHVLALLSILKWVSGTECGVSIGQYIQSEQSFPRAADSTNDRTYTTAGGLHSARSSVMVSGNQVLQTAWFTQKCSLKVLEGFPCSFLRVFTLTSWCRQPFVESSIMSLQKNDVAIWKPKCVESYHII